MMDRLKIYCVTNVKSPPVQLSHIPHDEKSYSISLPLPLPDQVILFAPGPWSQYTDETVAMVTIIVNNNMADLGVLSNKTRSVFWDKPRGFDAGVTNMKAELFVHIDGKMVNNHVSVLEKTMDKIDKTENCLQESAVFANKENIMWVKPKPGIKPMKRKHDKGLKQTRLWNENGTLSVCNKENVTDVISAHLDRVIEDVVMGRMLGDIATKIDRVTLKMIKMVVEADVLDVGSDKMGDKVVEDVGTQEETIHDRIPTPVVECERKAFCHDVALKGDEDTPLCRWGHSLSLINENTSLLIGGQGDKQQLCKDSIWSLNTDTREWTSPDTLYEGQNPELRMGHSATYDPIVRCLYIYGGSKNKKWFHDVHMLDVDEWKWQLVKTDGKAPTRAYHTANLYRHEIWIFGGVYPRPDPQPDGCSNDLHIFSPTMSIWYMPIVKGDKPLPRSGHSMTTLGDELVMFGGWDAPICYNDLYVLDLITLCWRQADVKGTPPKPRSWHASCALSENRVLIHGGYDGNLALSDTHIFNLKTETWTELTFSPSPSPRAGHPAVCLPFNHESDDHDEVLIFGGGDNDGSFFMDLYRLSVPFTKKKLR